MHGMQFKLVAIMAGSKNSRVVSGDIDHRNLWKSLKDIAQLRILETKRLRLIQVMKRINTRTVICVKYRRR
jgi:hypothetical protein